MTFAISPLLVAATGGALLLPYFVFSFIANDALRESKTIVQGIATGVALLLLAFQRQDPRPRLSKGMACGLFSLAALVLMSFAKGVAGPLDPFVAVPLLTGAGLFLLGATASGETLWEKVSPWLAAAGAFTGLLATLQRTGDILRLPVEVPEPRFHAAALIGNPGDVGMALVVPALLFTFQFLESSSRKAMALAGLVLVCTGLAATGSLTAMVAVSASILFGLIMSPGRRRAGLVLFAGGTLAFLLSGGGSRVLEKTRKLTRGEVGDLFTQRDIALLSAMEMVRSHPILGVGPGGFSSQFITAKTRAEERWKRRMNHKSESAHFENAHSEPLNIAAESGLPAAVAATAFLFLVVSGLFRERRQETSETSHALANGPLLVILMALGIISLTNFPLRIAVTMGPLAFLLGLASRRAISESASHGGTWWPRVALASGGGLLVLLTSIRGLAYEHAASGENLFRAALQAPAEFRADMLNAAQERLSAALSLSSRRATAWLALGSVRRAQNNIEGAWEAYINSVKLEERAETVLNLARIADTRGEPALARALTLRAVWTLPRLLGFVPEGIDSEEVRLEIERREAGLATGSLMPPPLPDCDRR